MTHDKNPESDATTMQARIEENLGVPLFRDAPPVGHRGANKIAIIINTVRKMEQEFNAEIRDLSTKNSELGTQLAFQSKEFAEINVKLFEAEIRLNAAILDLSDKQVSLLLPAGA